MKEKVTLKPIIPNTIYFPSIDEFARFLGFGISARSKARIFKELLSSDLKVSARSLDNLGSKGISEKTARRAFWPRSAWLCAADRWRPDPVGRHIRRC